MKAYNFYIKLSTQGGGGGKDSPLNRNFHIMLLLVLQGCEAYSRTLRGEHQLSGLRTKRWGNTVNLRHRINWEWRKSHMRSFTILNIFRTQVP